MVETSCGQNQAGTTSLKRLSRGYFPLKYPIIYVIITSTVENEISLKKVPDNLSNAFYLSAFFFVQIFVLIGEAIIHLIFSPYYLIRFIVNRIFLARRRPAPVNDYVLPRRSIRRGYYPARPSAAVKTTKKTAVHIGSFLQQAVLAIGKGCLVVGKAVLLFTYHTIARIVSLIIWIILLPYRLFMTLFSKEFRFFLFGFAICFSVIIAYEAYLFVVDLPSPTNIGKVNFAQSTHLYDRNGKLLYEIYRDQNRTPVKLNELPAYVYQASIAIEDKDFFKHNGVSLTSGILRAIRESVVNKNLQGGSTITQQLVKTALLTPDRTFQRKIKEIILALWTEKLYTKQQILEMYINQVSYGGSTYGIEEASKTYFGKDAKDLTLDEAAFLAGLPQAPSVYSPYVNPDIAATRRNEVLKKMMEQGYISRDLEEKALAAQISVQPLTTMMKAPHFVFFVKNDLEQKYGSSTVEQGGLNVTTSLDLDVQTAAEQILKEELAKIQNLNVANGAILVTKPSTGEILAMVGSVDYYSEPSGAFNVTTALRQPGSSIKPLMYSLALTRGFTAASILDDSPVIYKDQWGNSYQPVNYDGKFHGQVPLRYALANSFNVTAVRTLSAVGVDNFVDQARKMGISTWNDRSGFGLSLTLGGGEVHMTDMAEAYGVFANQGNRVPLNDVLHISDMTDKRIYDMQPSSTQVLDSGVAYILSDILSDNFARQWEFGPHSALEIPGYKVAVKTGTTDDKRDNWTIGYTPQYLVAVWVGNNDNAPMNQALASGITGAAPVWNRVMKYVLTKYGYGGWYSKPDDVTEKACYYGKTEYFIKGTENVSCGGSYGGPSPVQSVSP